MFAVGRLSRSFYLQSAAVIAEWLLLQLRHLPLVLDYGCDSPDSFLWGVLKDLTYATKLQTVHGFKREIQCLSHLRTAFIGEIVEEI